MVKRLVIAGALTLGVVFGACGWFFSYALLPGPAHETARVVVEIEPGSSVGQIGQRLAAAGLLTDDVRFILLARFMGVSGRLPAGEFELTANQRPIDLIRELVVARPIEYLVTIPEGLTIREIAHVLAADGWVDEGTFISLAHDPLLVSALGLGSLTSLEGYLFPDSYRLVRPAPSERDLLARLVGKAMSVWEGLPTGNLALNRQEVFTLASIVEKETGNPEERPVIAAVFLNRLARGMRLQSDPTAIYGVEGFAGKITRDDLRTASPYNTYLISGLPPGPICNPGRAALAAVLQPAETNFLYFVAKNDGTHHFSATLREHNQAIRRYQR